MIGTIREMTAPPRLLLVDDERSITDGLAPFLTRSGFDVRVAADGQDAWDQVRTWHPDIVVSDVVMPVFDGRELVRRLREAGDGGGRRRGGVGGRR